MTQPIRLDTYTQLIHHLATWRHTNHISQTQIARQLGIATSTLSAWENQHRISPGDHLLDWTHTTGLDIWIRNRQPELTLKKGDQGRQP